MKKKELSKGILFLLVAVAVLILSYFILPKAIEVFLPFIFAYFISLIMKPLTDFLSSKIRLPKKLAAGISTFLVIGVLAAILYFIVFRVVLYIQDVVADWENVKAYWTGIYYDLHNNVEELYASASPEVQSVINSAVDSLAAELKTFITPVVNAVIGFATNFAISLPSVLIFTVVTFLASYFMLGEREMIVSLTEKAFGRNALDRIAETYKSMMHALGGYVKAQLLIMAIVSIPIMIGLYIAGVKHFVLIAILIAIFDALPIFGSGAVLIPWALYGVITESYGVAIIMLALYVIVIISRQMLEPKIVGEHIGVPPLITLISMYAGLKLFGIFGMILGPVLVIIVRNLYIAGAFDFLKNKENSPEEINDGEDAEGEIDGQ